MITILQSSTVTVAIELKEAMLHINMGHITTLYFALPSDTKIQENAVLLQTTNVVARILISCAARLE